jgi:putative ubiquitin-RnfH superfamily antitoxin RatB of RatAB toxin-antitoxin module
MKIEIIYAQNTAVFHERLEVPVQTTVQDAITRSSLLQRYPEIDWHINKVGIYGRLVSSDSALNENDRIEIYRPLQATKKRTD